MPFISQYTRQSTNADNDLFLFEVNGGSYRAITFANLKASLVSGTAGTGNMVYEGVTPVTAGSIPSFSDTTGFNFNEGYDVGLLVGNITQLLDVGGGMPGFGIIDGSNLINVPVPDVSNLVTGPASAIDQSLPIFDGTTGKIIDQGPRLGTDIGDVTKLVNVGGIAGFPAVDGSLLTNLPGDITTPGTTVIGNITSWGDIVGDTLLDSGVSATQVTTNASGIATNAGDIATNAGDIATNATDITGKLDKSPIDGIAYMQLNGAIFVPDTSDVDDSIDRRYVLDNDLIKIANLPQDTSLEIGKKQDKSPVDGVLYGLIDGGISPVPTAVGDVVGPAISVNGEIALFDGITGKLIKTGPSFGVDIGDAILLEDVSSNAALPAVDGSQLTNLPIVPSSLQASYDISGQPQFSITGLGSLQIKEALNDASNLILEGQTFFDVTTFSVSGAGDVIGNTFNGVALTILGGERSFLNQAGSYAKIEDYQLYKFSNSTVDSDPGSNFLRYDNNTYALVTQIFVSKNQLGGLDIESQLLGVSINSIISITQRSSSSLAQTWTVTGLPVDATTYVKIPVTLLETTAFTLNNNQELNFRIDNSPALLESLNLEDSSKILSGGVVTIDAPGVPAGESFSVTAGIARIVQPDGAKLDIDFGPFNGILYTETGEFANLFIDSGGLLDQRDNAQPADFRLSAILGFLARDLTGQLVVVGKLPNPAYQTWAQLSDIIQFISGAADASARIDSNSADTSFQRFAGTGIVFLGNILADINNPNIVSMTAANPTTFRVFLRDGTDESTIYSGLGTDTLIDPSVYDGGATAGDPLIAIPGSNNQSQIIRVFWQPGALTGPEIRFIHGQVLFTNIGEALNGLATYFPLIPTPVELGSIDLGGVIVRKGASDFTDQGDAVFFRRSQVAGGGGGSVAQSLQETYSLSVQPQFLINLSQGGVQYKDGTNNTAQTLIEALDFNDTTVFDVNGNGIQTAIGLEAARTGVSSMDGPIVAGVLDTDVNIPAGNGFIVNSYSAYESNSITAVSWLADTTFTIPNLGVDSETFIFVNSSGVIQSQNTPLTETQLSDTIFLGSTINGFILNQVLVIINAPDIIGNTGNSFRSQNNFRGPTQTGGAVEQTDNPVTNGFLAFKIGSIEVFKLGINWHTSRSNSDVITLAATDPTTFLYMVQDGSAESSGNTLIDPIRFDNGGVLTVIPGVGTLATIQYVWKLISGNVVVTYGQFVYTDILTASRSLGLDRTLRVVPSVLETYATELAAIIITKQSLDLADLTNTIISQNQSSGATNGGGATTFLSLTDTPAVAGTVDTILSWDSSNKLQNTNWSFRETATAGFFEPLTVPGTGSLFFGFFTNNVNSNSLGSTVVGQNSANKLGDDNDQINIFGSRNMNATSTPGVLSKVFINAHNSFGALAAGTDISGIGSLIGTNLTAGTRVSIFGSSGSGNALVNATDVHIYGKNVGPAGTVSDYVDFHSTIKMNTSSNTVIIGGAVNVPTANTQFSMSFDSSNQVIRLNRLNQTSEDAHTSAAAEFWYNTTLSKYRGNDGSIFSFAKEGLPEKYISWPNGLRRLNSTSLRMEAPLAARDDNGTFDFVVTAALDASRLVSGLGGINATQFPAKGGQFYNIRLVGDSTGVLPNDVELIELGTNPVLPTGFDKRLTLFPPALTTAGAQWVVTTYAVLGNSIRTYYFQSESLSQVLVNGAAIVNTSLDLNSLVPTGFRSLAHLNVGFLVGVGGSPTDAVLIASNEENISGQNAQISPGFINTVDELRQNMDCITDATAAIQYVQTDNNTTGTNRTNIFVNGFTMSNRRI